MSRIFLIIFSLFNLLQPAYSEQAIRLKTSCVKCVMNEPITIEIVVPDKWPKITAPKIMKISKGGKVSASISHSMQFIGTGSSIRIEDFNYQKDTIYNFQLIIKEIGFYSIGPVKMSLNNKVYSSNEIKISVNKIESSNHPFSPQLKVIMEPANPYKWEPILVRYFLDDTPIDKIIGRPEMRMVPRMEGAIVKELKNWQPNLSNGQNRIPLVAFIIYPMKHGAHNLKHATFNIAVENDVSIFGFFQAPFRQNKVIHLPDQVLSIQELPHNLIEILSNNTKSSVIISRDFISRKIYLSQGEKNILSNNKGEYRIEEDKPLNLTVEYFGSVYWPGITMPRIQIIEKKNAKIILNNTDFSMPLLKESKGLTQGKLKDNYLMVIKAKLKIILPDIYYYNTQQKQIKKINNAILNLVSYKSEQLSLNNLQSKEKKEQERNFLQENRFLFFLQDNIFFIIFFLILLLIFFIHQYKSNVKLNWGNSEKQFILKRQASDREVNDKIIDKREEDFSDDDLDNDLIEKKNRPISEMQLLKMKNNLINSLEKCYRNYITQPEKDKARNVEMTCKELTSIFKEIQSLIGETEKENKIILLINRIDELMYGPKKNQEYTDQLIFAMVNEALDLIR